MSRLADILSQIDTKLGAITGLVTYLGAEYIANNGVPPRIVYVPSSDTFAGAMRQGFTSQPKSRASCFAGVEAHIWAAGAPSDTDPYKDIRAVEALRDEFIFRCHEAAVGAVEFMEGQWLPSTAGQLGRVYVLKIRFVTPVTPYDDGRQVVPVTSAQTTVSASTTAGTANFTTEE